MLKYVFIKPKLTRMLKEVVGIFSPLFSGRF